MDATNVSCDQGHSIRRIRLDKYNMVTRVTFQLQCKLCTKWIEKQEFFPYTCGLCNYYLCEYCFKRELNDINNRGIGVIKYSSHNVAKNNDGVVSYIYYNSRLIFRICNRFFLAPTLNPLTVLLSLKQVNPKYWYKCVRLVIKIIQKAMFEKVACAKSYSEEDLIKRKHKRIDYQRLKYKLQRYSQMHNCWKFFFNILDQFGFILDTHYFDSKPLLVWDWTFLQKDSYVNTDVLFCEMKNMIGDNLKIFPGYHDQVFYDDLTKNTLLLLIDGYSLCCMHRRIGLSLCNLIALYSFDEYPIKHCYANREIRFKDNLQLLQDPQGSKCIMMHIDAQIYMYFHIPEFKRPNGYIERPVLMDNIMDWSTSESDLYD
eukprot:159494_1